MVGYEEKAKFCNIEMFFCPKIAEKGIIIFKKVFYFKFVWKSWNVNVYKITKIKYGKRMKCQFTFVVILVSMYVQTLRTVFGGFFQFHYHYYQTYKGKT